MHAVVTVFICTHFMNSMQAALALYVAPDPAGSAGGTTRGMQHVIRGSALAILGLLPSCEVEIMRSVDFVRQARCDSESRDVTRSLPHALGVRPSAVHRGGARIQHRDSCSQVHRAIVYFSLAYERELQGASGRVHMRVDELKPAVMIMSFTLRLQGLTKFSWKKARL